MNISIVIPAYNEEERIGAVLSAALKVSGINEIIVVTDGCTDKTAEKARAFENVHVIEMKENRGKGAAMCEGINHSAGSIIVFLDADLQGLQPEHVTDLIKPVAGCNADMCIGVFREGKWNTTLSQLISPNISGQRAIKKAILEQIPNLDSARFGVEVKINKFMRRNKYRTKRVILRGVTHTVKEVKLGKIRGLAARMKMYYDIMKVYFFEILS